MKKLILGNWKMFTAKEAAFTLAAAVKGGAAQLPAGVEVGVCPPFVHLDAVGQVLAGSTVALGAQNCADRGESALTGEVAASMLPAYGCTYVILGHSERRQNFGEGGAYLAHKIEQVLAHGMVPVLCIGETEAQYMAGETTAVLTAQLTELNLGAMAWDKTPRLVIAYEPVWAIGTGKIPQMPEITAAHAHIARVLNDVLPSTVARQILYGGSVKPDNAAAIFALNGVDGALVGGASLKAADFLKIAGAVT